MDIKLTGTYTMDTYRWYPEVQNNLPVGIITVPVKVQLQVVDNKAKFILWEYEAIKEGNDPAQHRKVWKGDFQLTDPEPAYSEHKDMSGGQWRTLSWIGKYVSWGQTFHEFRISICDRFCTADARWPHKHYQVRSVNKEMRFEGTLFDIDEKSFIILNELMEKVKNVEISERQG